MSRIFATDADRWRAVLAITVLAVLPLVIIQDGSTFQQQLFINVVVFAIIAVGLNIVFGHTDQLFLFVGALTGVSTYMTILLADAFGVSPWLTIPIGVIAVAGIGMFVSYLAARLQMSIIVIAILTLSLQLAMEEFFQGARSITGGTTGFAFEGLELSAVETGLGMIPFVTIPDGFGNYYVLLAILAGSLVLYSQMMGSKYGLAFDAIRQDEVAAESVGIDIIRYKIIAAGTGAALIGLVGPLYANAEGWVTPSLFTFQQIDVLVLIMLVLGGLRTMLGPVVGAGVIIFLNKDLQSLFGQWRTAIYGLLLIFLFLYFRDGVVQKLGTIRELKLVEQFQSRLPERSSEK
jgi:branched-chain amino acid transport system permease protein